MQDDLTLGDLRRLVERLEGQPDGVKVDVIVTMPGLQVACPTSNWAMTESRPLEAHGKGVAVKVRQTEGYHDGFGPAAGIVVFAVAG